jgi:hypothetical protein
MNVVQNGRDVFSTLTGDINCGDLVSRSFTFVDD